MNSFRRLFSLILMIALIFAVIPKAAQAEDIRVSGTCGDDIRWTYYRQSGAQYGSLSLYGSGEMYDYQWITSPWADYRNDINIISVGGDVTAIGQYAFAGCSNVTRVMLPPSIKIIRSEAFSYCTSLTTILTGIAPEFKEELPSGLEEIGVGAFQDCYSLKSITIPDSVTFLAGATFQSCTALERVWLSRNLDTIYGSTFEGCTSLRNVIIWDKVTLIQPRVFEYCKNLRIVIHSMDYAIGSNADYFGDPSEITLAAPKFSPTERYAKKLGYRFTDTGLPPNPFSDLESGKYYYENVLWAYYQDPKITSGTTDTTFEPDKKINRAQAVTFLWNAAGKPSIGTLSSPFDDVTGSSYYIRAVIWAYNKGITTGTTDTTFEPDKSCTRAEVVTFLWKAAGKPAPKTTKNPFPDVKKGTWYYKAVLWGVENGIVSGFDDGTFGTSKTCTRGQFVTFLRRFMNKFPDILQ